MTKCHFCDYWYYMYLVITRSLNWFQKFKNIQNLNCSRNHAFLYSTIKHVDKWTFTWQFFRQNIFFFSFDNFRLYCRWKVWKYLCAREKCKSSHLWKTKKVLLLILPKMRGGRRGGGYLYPLNPIAPLVPSSLRTISSMHAVISSTDVVNWGHNFEWPIAKWPSFSSFFSTGVEKSSETLSKIPHTKTRQNRLWSFELKEPKYPLILSDLLQNDPHFLHSSALV